MLAAAAVAAAGAAADTLDPTTATAMGLGSRISAPPASALYEALRSNPDLATRAKSDCGLDLPAPDAEPIPAVVNPAPTPVHISPDESVSAEHSVYVWLSVFEALALVIVDPPSPPRVQPLACKKGQLCGNACIPRDHVCHRTLEQGVGTARAAADAPPVATTSRTDTGLPPAEPSSSSRPATVTKHEAAPHASGDTYEVHGYYRKDGTYVVPYLRHYPHRSE
jgi:hypothetical protein